MKINQAFTILQRAGGIRAARIITQNNDKLSRLRVFFICRALRRGVPVAKIIHQKWFYGLSFYTNRHTLDPRPDTETLVAAVISDAPAHPRILDLGTGTGCILISLVKNISGASGLGVDVSRGALRVARKNIARHVPGRVSVLRRSYHCADIPTTPFDVIVSNPPYIARGDSRVDAGAMHDPKWALYAGDDGYAEYAVIAKNARHWLKPSGKIYLEIGEGMADRVQAIFQEALWRFVRAERDLAGITRVLVFER